MATNSVDRGQNLKFCPRYQRKALRNGGKNVKNLFPTNKKQLSRRESYKKCQIIVMNCS